MTTSKILGFALDGILYRLLVGKILHLEARRGYLALWDPVREHELPGILGNLLLKKEPPAEIQFSSMRLLHRERSSLRRIFGFPPAFYLEQLRGANWCPVRARELVRGVPTSGTQVLDQPTPAALWGIYAVLSEGERPRTRPSLRLVHP